MKIIEINVLELSHLVDNGLSQKEVANHFNVSVSTIKRLYEKHNFKQDGVRKGYYEDNKEDAIIMWLREN